MRFLSLHCALSVLRLPWVELWSTAGKMSTYSMQIGTPLSTREFAIGSLCSLPDLLAKSLPVLAKTLSPLLKDTG
jgi:hypothetical protein